MMRSPYQSPKDPPARRFLRLQPRGKKRKRGVLFWGGALFLGYLVYSFVGGDTGILRIQALKDENRALRKRKLDLAAEATRAEADRNNLAKDPLLTERVARERFHMVRKDEILYRFDPEEGPTK